MGAKVVFNPCFNKFRCVSNLLCFKSSKVKYTTYIATGTCHTSDVHPMRNPIERLSKPLLYSNIRGWLVSWSQSTTPMPGKTCQSAMLVSWLMTYLNFQKLFAFPASLTMFHPNAIKNRQHSGSFPPSFAQLPAIRKEDAILCLLWNTQQRQFPELSQSDSFGDEHDGLSL